MISDETINKMIDGKIVKCPKCKKGYFHATRCDDGFYTFECDHCKMKQWGSRYEKGFDLFFLNPTEGLYEKLKSHLLDNEFIISKEYNDSFTVTTEKTTVEVSVYEDDDGRLIKVKVTGGSRYTFSELLMFCPECKSVNLKPIISPDWKNELTDRAFEYGRLEYETGKYTRIGAKPPTKICIDCGCKWHNGLDEKKWNDMARVHMELTYSDLFEFSDFSKENPENTIWETHRIDCMDGGWFSFDKKTVYNFYSGYRQLTEAQKKIFAKEYPWWTEYFFK